MAMDRPAETKISANQRSADLIINRLNEYLSIRFDHAGRINPQLRAIKQDLLYHEMVNVRRCLLGEKIYGPIRLNVSDVFLSDDDKKRRGLMSPTDQTSIQVELVSHCQDERVEATRGQIRIHDLKTFYAAIDEGLASLMDLVETWIWWDILDAAEQVRFEQKLSIIAVARQRRLPEELRKRYAALIHPATEEGATTAVNDDDVVRYELKQLQFIRDQWHIRRQNERGFMYVLKRDELPPPNQGEMIQQIVQRVREYDAIAGAEDLVEEQRQRYAGDLRLTPDKVTQEAVLELLQGDMIRVEREMVSQADRESHLGAPYNYKERQLEQMSKWLGDLEAQLRVAAPKPPAPASGPNQAPPAQGAQAAPAK